MKLPVKHLSARVPWHDHGWDGSVCENPSDNSFCRVLPNIDMNKDVENECKYCAQRFEDLDFVPPCVGEKGGFLSSTEHKRTLSHAYKVKSNKQTREIFKDFRDVTFVHKPFSINAVPYRWMLKDSNNHTSEMAQQYGLDYDTEKEDELCSRFGFPTDWVQHRDNQRVMLDSFFSSFEPNKSLIFFYAKHTPISEINQKTIIGAAYVKYVGDIIDFEYPPNYKGHRSYVWDRHIYHSLINQADGCILPYHELIKYETQHPEDSYLCRDCVCYAPNHEQFTHASELVDNDVAIDALFELCASFRKAGEILKQDYSSQLEWLDHAISHVWEMRGAFPSMGSVITAKEFENGNSVAWRIEQYIIDTYGDIYGADPWEIFDKCIKGSVEVPGLKITATIRTQWNRALSDTDKMKMRLLSRIQMNEEQARIAFEIGVDLDNPYTLFEESCRDSISISFNAIDKACYPAKIIAESYPLKETPAFDDQLDMRRVRAALIFALENYSDLGNTLVVQEDLVKHIDEAALSAPIPLTAALLENYCCDDFFCAYILRKTSDSAVFFKLCRFEAVRKKIVEKLKLEVLEKRQLPCPETADDLRKHLDNQISTRYDLENLVDVQSRHEKVEAMSILAKYSFSVLVGPAGSGKTTLLKALCDVPSIKSKRVILLAPTGKARVKMAHTALTIAQFLYRLKRYDIFTGQYYMNPSERRESCGTLIIDEASMLTEEQLAAILDAVIAERVILIGDYKQLPPIGAGRPFFDIVQKLKPKDGKLIGTAYAEITNISRQKAGNGGERLDVKLSRYFGNPKKEDFLHIQDLVEQIQTNKNDEIKLIRWDSGEDLQEKLISEISNNLKLKKDDLVGSFEEIALGRVSDKFFNFGASEKVIESWQIMSPLNGHAYGVKEINKVIQKTFRQETIKWALQNWSPIPNPVGRDNFVYGDKVINLGNRSFKKNSIVPSSYPDPLYYMANGEIGIVVGEWRSEKKQKENYRKPNVWIAFSSQQGYAYSFYQTQFGEEEGAYDFELAYCISVHKSQGSGFRQTFFILPAGNPIISKELLYTALTRQEDSVTILHQGNFYDFLKYSSNEYSETARRLTDLFELPSIQILNQRYYDSRYVNITLRGEPVISKSETLIANILYSYEKQGDITYVYESKYKISPERELKPDFLIEHVSTGRKFVWEHLGRLDSEDYRQKWELKNQAYISTGAIPAETATIEDNLVLITSEDAPEGGIDSREIEKKIKKYILLED